MIGKHLTLHLSTLLVLSVVMVTAGPCLATGMAIEAVAQAGVNVGIEGLPPVTAPGASVVLNWFVENGTSVDETYVQWDTSSRQYSEDYRYRTRHYSGLPGHFYDYIDVPQTAQTIYLKVYAVVDGVLYSTREYTVPTRRAINVGSENAGFDAFGEWWYADIGYQDGRYGFEDGNVHSVTRPIAGTTDQWIYGTQRQGVSSFRAWLTNGPESITLEIALHFAELELDAADQRVFDVVIEKGTPNQVSIPDVDIYGLAGRDRAHVITRTVTVTDTELNIDFEADTTEPPILNGLVLHGSSGVPQRHAVSLVAFGDDDTYVLGENNYRRAEQLLLGADGVYHAGLRFYCVQVLQGAIINHAELRVVSSEVIYSEMNVRIYAEPADSSADFRNPPLVQDRPRTAASALWHAPELRGWVAGRQVSSPELREVIQEIVNRPGWRSCRTLNLLLIAEPGGPAARRIWSIEGSYADRASLLIEYTPRDLSTPTLAPTRTFTPVPTSTPTPTATQPPILAPTPTVTPTATRTATPTATRTSTATATPTLQGLLAHLPLVHKPFLKVR